MKALYPPIPFDQPCLGGRTKLPIRLKTLVFTEFVPTQEMLRRFSDRARLLGGVPERLHGHGRARSGCQEAFAREARILISTDAGGKA